MMLSFNALMYPVSSDMIKEKLESLGYVDVEVIFTTKDVNKIRIEANRVDGSQIDDSDYTVIESVLNTIISERKANEYKELRRKEYPPIDDQLDAIWKMLTPPTGSEAEIIKKKIEAIKAKYPKPV